MSDQEKKPAYLRVVRFDERREDAKDWEWSVGTQLSLFPLSTPAMLGLFALSATSAVMFVDVLTRMRPRYVIDVRSVPRFDFARMTRAFALELLEGLRTTYVDASAALRIRERRNALVHSGALSEYVNAMVTVDNGREGPGPLLFLLDDDESMIAGADVLPKTLVPRPRGGWIVHTFRQAGDVATK